MTTIPRRAWTRQIMGMPISLHVRGAELSIEHQVEQVFASLRDADALFSTYREDSQLSQWERGELALADADPALAEVFELCEEARHRTGGYFDARSLPRVSGEGRHYDPSGLVKGWAVERAAGHLAELTAHSWCLNAGGDVLVRTADGHPAWRVGIEDPFDRARIARVFSVANGAVATSGTARRGSHIVNPHDGQPVMAVCSVTVTGPSLVWADVYATAAIARGEGAASWLSSINEYQGMIVKADGEAKLVWPGEGG